MGYIKIRFGKNLGHMHGRLQRTIDEMLRQVNPMLVVSEQTWRPQMDVYEATKTIRNWDEKLKAQSSKQIDRFLPASFQLPGLRQETARVPGMKYHLAEIAYGRFERILLLPVPINPQEVKASYTNGLLKITMAKPLRKQARQIPIEDE